MYDNKTNADFSSLLTIWSWLFRYIHIALDTYVLFGALRERSMDERSDSARSGAVAAGESPSGSAMARVSDYVRKTVASGSP